MLSSVSVRFRCEVYCTIDGPALVLYTVYHSLVGHRYGARIRSSTSWQADGQIIQVILHNECGNPGSIHIGRSRGISLCNPNNTVFSYGFNRMTTTILQCNYTIYKLRSG